MEYSKKSLMLFPYHLSDVIIKGLFTTPFDYYVSILESLMNQEKSYDSLPNFTAADCKKHNDLCKSARIPLILASFRFETARYWAQPVH